MKRDGYFIMFHIRKHFSSKTMALLCRDNYASYLSLFFLTKLLKPYTPSGKGQGKMCNLTPAKQWTYDGSLVLVNCLPSGCLPWLSAGHPVVLSAGCFFQPHRF